MPFGKKADLAGSGEIDFDQIYESAIEPAIKDAGLTPIRGDREGSGGIIHASMFGRLLLSDFAVADLTLANPNVFYELGVRHTARPYTTIPIFAARSPLPFDVAFVRAIPYHLEDGKLSGDGAASLRAALRERLNQAIQGAATKDSPLFQLIPNFPRIDLPHEVTEIFQDQVRQSEEFKDRLAAARSRGKDALREIWDSLGDLKVVRPEILVDLMLSFRDASGWDEMVRMEAEFPDALRANVLVRQQRALALNRRNEPGDRDRARAILEALVKERGADPETLGILGRVYKDRYRELKKTNHAAAPAALDSAIETYTRGFESDPRDYYPGVNAVTLLIEKGDPESLARADRLAPLVSFAVMRRGGASSNDYWDLATVLELSAVDGNWPLVNRVLPRVLLAAKASWQIKTTCDNILLLRAARERAGQDVSELEQTIARLRERHDELEGKV